MCVGVFCQECFLKHPPSGPEGPSLSLVSSPLMSHVTVEARSGRLRASVPWTRRLRRDAFFGQRKVHSAWKRSL